MMADKTVSWRFEISAPRESKNYDNHYNAKIVPLRRHSNKLSITSKPDQRGGRTGFECSLDYCRYLLSKNQELEILFHLTCHDLNKSNLDQLRPLWTELGIRDLLVITGDNYREETTSELQFANSDELVESIAVQFGTQLRTLAVAAYPGGNQRNSFDNAQECQRLRRKILAGANSVYTQCLFEAAQFELFQQEMRKNFGYAIEIVPSVALFGGQQDLLKIHSLTGSASCLSLIEQSKSNEESQLYLINLCRHLRYLLLSEDRREPVGGARPSIDLCLFGHFELVESLVSKFSCGS